MERYGPYIDSYLLHRSSVFYLLFSVPEFSRGLDNFCYNLLSEEDSILFIDIFLQIEMFKIVDRIISHYPIISGYVNGIISLKDFLNSIILENPNRSKMAKTYPLNKKKSDGF